MKKLFFISLFALLMVGLCQFSLLRQEEGLVIEAPQNFSFVCRNVVANIVNGSLWLSQGATFYHIPMTQVWDYVVSADGLTCEVIICEGGPVLYFNK